MSMKPNRRDAVKGIAALAAGLFAAPAAGAKPKPAPSDLERELREWEEEQYGPPGGVKRRLLDAALVTLLPAYREVAAAMNAVLDAEPDVADDSTWLEDVAGVRFFAGLFAVMLDGEAHAAVEKAAGAELRRRLDAHERGAYHGCPVFWGWDAIRRAQQAARAVRDVEYPPGQKPCLVIRDVEYQAWATEFWEGTYDNECHLHMNGAAARAWQDAVLGHIDGLESGRLRA